MVWENAQDLSFRGIVVKAVLGFKFGFSHEQAENKMIFKGENTVIPLGKKNPTYQFSVIFSEDLYQGDYFETYQAFKLACENKEPGKLLTPDAILEAIVTSFESDATAENRGGVKVEVSFISTGKPAKIVGVANYGTVKSYADALATDAKLYDIPKDDNQPTLAETYANLVGEIGKSRAVFDRAAMSKNEAKAKADNITYRIKEMDRSMENAGCDRWEARDKTYKLREANSNLRKSMQPWIREYTVPYRMLSMVLAQKLDVSYQELIGLNPEIPRLGMYVPAGMIVKY